MRFLLDHDVPDAIAGVLASAGHEVEILRHQLPIQAADESVFQYAVQMKRVLISCNRDDFLQLSRRTRHSGIIILIRRRTRAAEAAALLRLLSRAGEPGVTGGVNFA